MMSLKYWILIVIMALISGCSGIKPATTDALVPDNYQRAIMDAAVIESSEIITLPVIADNRVRVVTWTAYPDSFKPGRETTLSWGDVWVTLDNAVKSRCRNFHPAERAADIQKLLGLPQDLTQKRSFVTLEVDAASLFRPCANPSIQAETCTAMFPDQVSLEHAAWFAHQAAQSYQLDNGYPWTRLGYTYNWKSGVNEIGPAEFVIKKNSRALTLSVMETELYCSN